MLKLTRALVKKSREAFLLALEIFNKPTVGYRAESFSIFFSNAWELLLKATLYEQAKGKKLSIFLKKERNKKRLTITLDNCLEKIFLNKNERIRKNIEYISEIRNEAAHLVIQELDPYFSRAFQSGVINYVNYLKNTFNIDINQYLNPGLISLISDKDRIVDMKILRKKYNKEDFKSIINWIQKFSELEKLGTEGAISINHTIAIVRNTNKADFIISAGGKGDNKAIIIEKLKDPNITHIFNRSEAIKEIIQRIQKGLRFTEYDFEAYVFTKGYKKTNNEYYWKSKYGNSPQYSQKFVDEFIGEINTKSLIQRRKQYQQHLKVVKK